MRKKITFYLSILLAITAGDVCAQGQYNTTNWRFSNPKPFGFTVMDVDFYDNSNVLAVGSDGGIAKSTDAGSTWTYGPFTFTNAAGFTVKSSLTDIHYVTSTVAYAVGSLGCMAKTTDAGLTWTLVNTPLFANARNINAVWFINKDTGYIGGQYNSADSIPKLYFTRNGGATWDSLNAPLGGKTRIGYINNPNLPPLDLTVDAKDKEILRIEFINSTTGYIIGSGSNLFPRFPSAVAATCLPTGTTTTTGSQNAALVWKFSSGTLTDYSVSKERLGYTGINTVPASITCTTTYGNITPQSQSYRAMNIINDSVIVIMSFNNNIVLRVNTGRGDSTLNANVPGLYEKGKYQVLNFPFPPLSQPSIPATQVLLASNPYQIRRAANGKLHASGNFGLMWTSIDTGKTWVRETCLPQGRNFSNLATWALDIAPNGKFLAMGAQGVVADSIPGTTWNSTYLTIPLSAAYNKIDFADCNNGIAAGSSNITVTTDGGATWVDKARADFAASFYSINGVSYVNPGKAYFAVSNGVLYNSLDKGTTLDPIYSDFTYQMNDVVGIGNDSIWAIGYSAFSVPAANRKSTLFKTSNNGVTWQVVDIAVTTTSPAFTAPTLSQLVFPSRNIGYVAGTRNAVYKTSDGGTTWTNISPFPALNFAPAGYPNSSVTYTEIFALNDNTAFVVGNMFLATNNRRIYKTTDGGSTWTDISGNIDQLSGGNLNGVLFHDANNGYVVGPGGVLYKTTNGGASWSLDLAPSNNLFSAMAFAPRSVPSSLSMANRKMFISGPSIGGAHIMEYGNLANILVNSTEAVVNTNCSNPTAGTITINATGGLTPYSYSLNGGTFQTSNIFSGLTQGPKTIIIKDAFCGTLTKTITIGFTDNLTLSTQPVDTSVCAGAPVPLLATSAANATYNWTPAGGLSATNISNPIATANSNTAYSVTATLNGCVKTATVNIGIKPNPLVNAGPDKSILDGDQVLLEGSGNTNVTSIAWTPAATILSGANSFNPLVKPNLTTTYTVTVRDANNCTATDNAIVTVIPYCVKPMDAFTPNGDGFNDRWVITNGTSCISTMAVAVYNRYGGLVYKNDQYQNNWDGTYDGKLVADGTYYYLITYKLFNGSSVATKGNVTILR